MIDQAGFNPTDRKQVEAACEEFVKRVINDGVPPLLLFESMAAVSHQHLADSPDRQQAVNYLELLVDRLKEEAREADDALIQGSAGTESPA